MKSSHNTSTCLKKHKEDKERKKEAKTGKTEKQEKPPTSRERKEMSEERRKQDLSKYRQNNGLLVALHNSCVQLQMMGSILSGNKDNLDDDLYKTPPETLDTESETEYDDNLNAPEISKDE